jgi:hypothetical protein
MKYLLIPTMLISFNVMAQEELTYDTMNRTWSYEKPGTESRYNPMELKWERAQPNEEPTYNPMESKWEYTDTGNSESSESDRQGHY